MFSVLVFKISSLHSSNRCAHLHESHRTLRDGSLGWRCPRHFVPGYDRTVPPGHFATAFRLERVTARLVVLRGGFRRFSKNCPEFLRFDDDEPLPEREQPADVPCPVVDLDLECRARRRSLFPQYLEHRVFADSLGRNQVCANRSGERFRRILPASKILAQGKIGMWFKLDDRRDDRLDSIGSEISVILSETTPRDKMPSVCVVGQAQGFDVPAYRLGFTWPAVRNP